MISIEKFREDIFKSAIAKEHEFYANLAFNNNADYICLSLYEEKGWSVFENVSGNISYTLLSEEEMLFCKLQHLDGPYIYIKSQCQDQ